MGEALESGLCFYGLEQKLRHVRGERKEERFLAQLSGQSANMALIFFSFHEASVYLPHSRGRIPASSVLPYYR